MCIRDRNIVKHANAEEKTTQFPASSLSLSMVSAMVKDDTAVGDAKIAIKVTKAIPRNPKNAAAPSPAAGTTISLAMTQMTRFFLHLSILVMLKDAPRITKACLLYTSRCV